MFTVESTWSPPTAVALWGNSSSEDEIDTEEIRWLKQTYLWNDSDDVTDCNGETISRENTSDSLHDSTREGTNFPSRHVCYYNTGQTAAEEENRSNNLRGHRHHYKHLRKKKILPPLNMKHQERGSEDVYNVSKNVTKTFCLPALTIPSQENLDRSLGEVELSSNNNNMNGSVKGTMNRKTRKQSNTKFKCKKSIRQDNVSNEKAKTSISKETRIPSVKRKSDKDAIASCDQVVLDIISPDKNPSTNYKAPIHDTSFPDIAVTNTRVQPQNKEAVKSKVIVVPNNIVSSNKASKGQLNTSSEKTDDVGTDIKSENKSKRNTFPVKNPETSGNSISLVNGKTTHQTMSSKTTRKMSTLNKNENSSTLKEKSGNKTLGSNLGGSSKNRQPKMTPTFSYSQRFKNVKNKFFIRNGILSHIRFDEEENDSDIDEDSELSSLNDSDSDEEDNTESEDESTSLSTSVEHNSSPSDVNDSTDDEDENFMKSKPSKQTFNHSAKTFRNFSYRKPPRRVHLETKTISISKKTVKRNDTKSVKWAVKLVKIRYFQRDVRSSFSDSN